MNIPLSQSIYDNKSQHERIVLYMLPGEILQAVYDCKGAGTSFVGLSDRRLIFYDQGMLIRKKTMVSIPYQRVIGIACADDESSILGTTEIVVLTAAGNFTFEFRHINRAQWVYQYVMDQVFCCAGTLT